MKKIYLVGLFVILFSFLVAAQEEHDFSEAKKLIDSGASCGDLTIEQLESIGDYYMEQMHPGEAHEYMDRMMGGEGSESLKQVHINIAKRIYCNENVGGMMGRGMMAGRGMMKNSYQSLQYSNTLYQNNFSIFQIFFYIIFTLVIVVIVLIINKSKNNKKQKGGKQNERQ